MERKEAEQPVRTYSRQLPLADFVREWAGRLLDQLGDHRLPRLYRRVIEQVEAVLIEQALERSGGNMSRAAEILGLHRNTLRNRMKALGVSPPGRGYKR